MPLDVAVAPKTLTSALHYLKRGSEKPAYYRIEPPPGVPRSNGIDDPHDVTIEDARGREAEFTLDRNGFALVKAPTAVADFYSPDEIKSVYSHVRGETSRVEYNPAHRWYYFSDMQPDEVVFIRVHDSANDGRARLSFHTSFDNPLTPGAPPRESIEVRTLVFFPPAA